MSRYEDLKLAETAAWMKYDTAKDHVEAVGERLLACIRKCSLDHPETDKRYCEYRDRLRDLEAAGNVWQRAFEDKKKWEEKQ